MTQTQSLPSAVESQSIGKVGNAASIAPRSPPTSITTTPCGTSRSRACSRSFRMITSPSVPPSKANRGSWRNSGGSASQWALGSYGGLLRMSS
jgi:hypothetical protein